MGTELTLGLWLLASLITAPLIGGLIMTTEQRKNWIMRQYVDIGLFIARQDGAQQAADYMLARNVPREVVLRVLNRV